MKQIPLSNGMVALVDDQDYALVAGYGRWTAIPNSRTYYAKKSYISREDGRQKQFSMHWLLTGWDLVDHINGNGLDNRRSNLRQATHQLNSFNKAPYRNNRSGYKGVSAKKNRWVAQITLGGRRTHIGYFGTPEEAARAYDAAARAAWGEFAWLNFPNEVAA